MTSFVKQAYANSHKRTPIRATEMDPARAVRSTVDAKNSRKFYRVWVKSRQKNEYR